MDTMQNEPLVTIQVDGKTVEIRAGREPVETIKKKGDVPAAYELDELINGKLEPLRDEGYIDIKGGEVFKSQPRKGHSS